MKECMNCWYKRQPKDDLLGIVPKTECPRCGAVYDKVWNENYYSIPSNEASPRNLNYGKVPPVEFGQIWQKSSGLLKATVILAFAGIVFSTYIYKSPPSEQLNVAPLTAIIYTASSSPSAKQAKQFLAEKGVSYKEIDIEWDGQGKAELRKLTGGESVPVIDMGGDIIRGWGPSSQREIEKKVAKHERAQRVSFYDYL